MKNNLKMTKGTLKYSAMRVDIIKKFNLLNLGGGGGEGQKRREVGRRVGGCQNYSQHITPGWGKAVWGNHV